MMNFNLFSSISMKIFLLTVIVCLYSNCFAQKTTSVLDEWAFWLNAKKNNQIPTDKAELLNNLIITKTPLPRFNSAKASDKACITGDCINGKGELMLGNKKIIASFIDGKPEGRGFIVFQTGDFFLTEFKGFDISNGTFFGTKVPDAKATLTKPMIIAGEAGLYFDREKQNDFFDLRNPNVFISVSDNSYAQHIILTISPDLSLKSEFYNVEQKEVVRRSLKFTNTFTLKKRNSNDSTYLVSYRKLIRKIPIGIEPVVQVSVNDSIYKGKASYEREEVKSFFNVDSKENTRENITYYEYKDSDGQVRLGERSQKEKYNTYSSISVTRYLFKCYCDNKLVSTVPVTHVDTETGRASTSGSTWTLNNQSFKYDNFLGMNTGTNPFDILLNEVQDNTCVYYPKKVIEAVEKAREAQYKNILLSEAKGEFVTALLLLDGIMNGIKLPTTDYKYYEKRGAILKKLTSSNSRDAELRRQLIVYNELIVEQLKKRKE